MQIGLEVKILGSLIDREIRAKVAVDNLDKMTNMHGHIIGFLRYNSDKEIFQRDIEKRFMISGASVSEILKLMEKNGLIERKPVERDGRLKKIVLTDKAIAMHDEVKASIDSVEREIDGLITEEERAEFDRIAMKLIEKLKQRKQEEAL